MRVGLAWVRMERASRVEILARVVWVARLVSMTRRSGLPWLCQWQEGLHWKREKYFDGKK